MELQSHRELGVRRAQGRLRGAWTLLGILLAGASLGRAELLGALSPFALPYLAAVFSVARFAYWPAVLGIALGSFGSSFQSQQLLSLGCFVLISTGWERLVKVPLRFPALWVGSSLAVAHGLLWLLAERQLRVGADLGMALAEGLLAMLLVPVFARAVPLFTAKRRRLFVRPEQTLAWFLVLSAMVMGTAHWSIGGVRFSDWLAPWLVAMVAWGGGGLWGGAFGTLILTMFRFLQDVGPSFLFPSLPLAGLLAGLLGVGRKRYWVIGCFGVSALWDVCLQYASIPPLSALVTVGLVVLSIALMPFSWSQQLASLVPGSASQESLQHGYLRRLRDVTAGRVEKFSQVFRELATSFEAVGKQRHVDPQPLLAELASAIAERVCPGCPKQTVCWDSGVEMTCNELQKIIKPLSSGDGSALPTVSWRKYCVRPQPTTAVLLETYAQRAVRERSQARLVAVRHLVRDQLGGMSEVMCNLAREIRQEVCVAETCEEKLSASLAALGLSIERVDVISLEPGRVDIEMILPGSEGREIARRRIAPALSQVMGEPVHLLRHAVQGGSKGRVIAGFGSAHCYRLRIGQATVAKDGKAISGDSSCAVDLGTGKFAFAVSDGMGSGKRAREESQAALRLLRELLQVGIAPLVVVQSVNTILRLRASDEEMFTTVDLALVDLHTAHGQFLKIGSAPGFVKRGTEVQRLRAAHPPIGILPTIDVSPLQIALKSGDLIILMTDGVYDAMEDAAWLRYLREITTRDPQHCADELLEQAWKHLGGVAQDDMTVIVAKVERRAGEWSTVRLPGLASPPPRSARR